MEEKGKYDTLLLGPVSCVKEIMLSSGILCFSKELEITAGTSLIL